MHQAINHFSNIELNTIRQQCNRENDNEDLRIKYILKEITDDDMKNQLMKRAKKTEKVVKILQIYEVINTVLTESIRDIYESILNSPEIIPNDPDDIEGTLVYPKGNTPLDIINRNLLRCNSIREYSNNELKKISVLYSQHVNIIGFNYYTVSQKYNETDINNLK